MSKKYVTD